MAMVLSIRPVCLGFPQGMSIYKFLVALLSATLDEQVRVSNNSML